MKKVAFFLLVYSFDFFPFHAKANGYQSTDTLKNIYSNTSCGLNYVQSSVRLGQKMVYNGLPFPGTLQPAAVSISGIPLNSIITKAFIWWDLTGPDTAGFVIIRNPDNETDTVQGTLVGSGGAQECWGIGAAAFRADVTGSISGNGNYFISGLPVDSIANVSNTDVNGASLFIVYKDPLAGYIGNLMINDGYFLAKFDTVTQSISNFTASDTSDYAKAIMLVSDLQNETGSALKMNNGSYQSITEDYWDFEERSTLVFQGQNTSVFGMQVPNDCSNFIMIGLYYQYFIDNTLPVISRFGDTLISSSGTSYQWSRNGISVPGAINQSYIVIQNGYYRVVVNNGDGCFFASDSVYVQCVAGFKPSIFSAGPLMWTADTVGYSFQWYMDTALISGANNSSYTAVDTGKFWLEVLDSLGCLSSTDTIKIDSVTGIDYITRVSKKYNIFPNPSGGIITIENTFYITENYKIQLYEMNGRLVCGSGKNIGSAGNYIRIDFSDISKGIYFLKIIHNQSLEVHKIVLL